MPCDLHLHSTASDGTLEPLEVAREVDRLGLLAFSITDHDTQEGSRIVAEHASDFTAEFVPGIEINTEQEQRDLHILGYYIQPDNPALTETLGALRQRRRERAERIIERLQQAGVEVSLEDVLEVAEGESIGRPHVARALHKLGYGGTPQEVFTRYLLPGGPGYVPRYRLAPKEAVALIKEAGGIPVLAHPGLVGDDNWIYTLKSAGLEGLEVFHTAHDPKTTAKYLKIARKQGLVVTGGSDSHGPLATRPIPIGNAQVPDWVYLELKAYWQRTRG